MLCLQRSVLAVLYIFWILISQKFHPKPKRDFFFYVRPVSKHPTSPASPWYENSPVGKEKLRTFLSAMCKEAGICEQKTNHSLRATGTTAMFNASTHEKMIREVTGQGQVHCIFTNALLLKNKKMSLQF